MTNPLDLKRLRKAAVEATKGPWGPWSGNYPFNVIVKKPAPSLSKHDDKRDDFWRYEDGVYVLEFNPETGLALLDEIDRLNNVISNSKSEIKNMENK